MRETLAGHIHLQGRREKICFEEIHTAGRSKNNQNDGSILCHLLQQNIQRDVTGLNLLLHILKVHGGERPQGGVHRTQTRTILPRPLPTQAFTVNLQLHTCEFQRWQNSILMFTLAHGCSFNKMGREILLTVDSRSRSSSMFQSNEINS